MVSALKWPKRWLEMVLISLLLPRTVFEIQLSDWLTIKYPFENQSKTAEPHAKLPGTIYTAADEIEKAGGKALPLVVDVREEKQVVGAVATAVDEFGGIDILINNASAISLTGRSQIHFRTKGLTQTVQPIYICYCWLYLFISLRSSLMSLKIIRIYNIEFH